MKPEEFQDCLKILKRNLKSFTQRLTASCRQVAVRLFKENFRDQGFWKDGKQRRRGVKGRSQSWQ